MTMNRTYKAAFGMALLLGAGAAGLAGAHGMEGMMGGSRAGMSMMQGGGMGMMQGIDLNDGQRSRIVELRSEQRDQQLARMADMLELRDEMQLLMAEQRPDPEAVGQLYGRMADLQGEMMVDRIRLQNDIQETLTSEQREQMRGRMQEWRGRMDGNPGRGGDNQRHHGGGW